MRKTDSTVLVKFYGHLNKIYLMIGNPNDANLDDKKVSEFILG